MILATENICQIKLYTNERKELIFMTLYEAKKGGSYCIEGLYVEPAITRRLQALGLNDGTMISVLNRKKKGALIIQVRGTRLALGKHISSSIEISGAADRTDSTSRVSPYGRENEGDGIVPEIKRTSEDGILRQDEQKSGMRENGEAVKQ